MARNKANTQPSLLTDPVEVAPFMPGPDDRKAEDWQREDAALPWQQARCRECKNPYWVRELRHDICEECGWLLREHMMEVTQKQNAARVDQYVNPFASDAFAGQTGSLPNPLKTE